MQNQFWLKAPRKATTPNRPSQPRASYKPFVLGWIIVQAALTVTPAWGQNPNPSPENPTRVEKPAKKADTGADNPLFLT